MRVWSNISLNDDKSKPSKESNGRFGPFSHFRPLSQNVPDNWPVQLQTELVDYDCYEGKKWIVIVVTKENYTKKKLRKLIF